MTKLPENKKVCEVCGDEKSIIIPAHTEWDPIKGTHIIDEEEIVCGCQLKIENEDGQELD